MSKPYQVEKVGDTPCIIGPGGYRRTCPHATVAACDCDDLNAAHAHGAASTNPAAVARVIEAARGVLKSPLARFETGAETNLRAALAALDGVPR